MFGIFGRKREEGELEHELEAALLDIDVLYHAAAGLLRMLEKAKRNPGLLHQEDVQQFVISAKEGITQIQNARNLR